METDTATAQPEARYEIIYHEHNQDFRGKGALVIRGSRPMFVFSGSQRRAFSFSSRAIEIEFTPEEIWNVEVTGSQVQFTTRGGESGRRNKPFIFFALSPEEAAAIAALLPTTKDTAFVEGAEFADKLKLLGGSESPWTSVTNIIIAANLVVFVLMGLAGAGWLEVADIMPYVRYGANRADVTADGEWWRLVACIFIHYGVIHLMLNMWALFQTGHLVERLFGRVPFTLAYFGSGITGSLATLLWHREKLIWSAGASGAVFGVYGALLGYMLREKHALPKSVFQPLLKSTLAFAGYNLLFGFIHPNIDNAAHIGGLAGGVLLGWILALPIDADARARLVPKRLGLGLTAVALIVAAGVMAAPRFDYRLKDEIEWSKANKAPTAKEPEIVSHERAALNALAKSRDTSEISQWITDQAIPFYERWRDDLNALKLAPGRVTEQRRKGFTRILQMKVDAYERLLIGFRQEDVSALKRYQEDEKKIAAEVKKLSDATKKSP